MADRMHRETNKICAVPSALRQEWRVEEGAVALRAQRTQVPQKCSQMPLCSPKAHWLCCPGEALTGACRSCMWLSGAIVPIHEEGRCVICLWSH